MAKDYQIESNIDQIGSKLSEHEHNVRSNVESASHSLNTTQIRDSQMQNHARID